MDVLGLDPTTALWLLSAREEADLVWSGDGAARSPSHRYRQAASAQKIFYEPPSSTEDLALEAAFEALGQSAPDVDRARATFRAVEARAPHYRFEAEGAIWRVRNVSTPTFEDPLVPDRWALLAKTDESELRRVELAGAEVAESLAWLPLLDGHHARDAVSAAARETAGGARVFDALEAIGALYEAPEEPFSLEQLPELLFLSHSSVLVRGREASVLVDPAIMTSTELLSSPGRRPFEIASAASAVVISHCHWDHLAFQSMIRIPRETTIFVPRVSSPSLVNPPLRTYLEAFGFRSVVEVEAWDEVTVGDVAITFCPFFGEPFGLGSRFDAFTYLVRANGRTIYGSLDACHDEAGDMDPTMRRLGEEHAIDVFLFGSSAQRHEPLYRAANMRHYSNELLGRPDLVRYHPDVDDVARWCALLRPAAIVPYANFVYFGADAEDARLSAGANAEAYWASLQGSPAVGAPAQRWRGELARLARSVAPPLIMLHPMQGLRL